MTADPGILELRAWRPIGATFRYLGRDCVVTGHSRSWVNVHGPGDVVEWPELQAEYADDLGVIRQVSFDLGQARALMGMQPDER